MGTIFMDRSNVQHEDDVWIAKYRAALEHIPVQPSVLKKFCADLRDTCNIVFSRWKKIRNYFTGWNPPRSAPSLKPMPVAPQPVLQTHSSMGRNRLAEANRKRSTKNATATTAHSRPPKSTEKRPVQREA
jgi:hypothetical protein